MPNLARSPIGESAFLVTYLRRELRRRMRQAVFIAVGLAVGVGLVVTVTAAAAGVSNAQSKVLHSLYGIGTDVTVTMPASSSSGRGPASAADSLSVGDTGLLNASTVASISRLGDVAAAAGGLTLTEVKAPSAAAGEKPANSIPTTVSVDGTDVKQLKLGPYASGEISPGRGFSASDANANVAIVDSHYASANKLSVGATISLAGTRFTIIGIISQPQGGSADIYIPLARAQVLTSYHGLKTLTGKVNVIYVAAASAADVASVQNEIAKLLPSASITSSADLAKAVSGSLASASNLANDLGTWLQVGVLIATFAIASLLTMAAVARRTREFGTLKALGWRTRRIIAQIMAESLVIGVIGAVLGIALGVGGAALIGAITPKLSATIGQDSDSSHTVEVHLTAHVTIGAIALAVLLALAGSLTAGSFGGWRASRLRPADALAEIE
jgi:putative ABC transport system permease protein